MAAQRRELRDLGDVATVLESIEEGISKESALNAERRKVDDFRAEALLELKTEWKTFMGPEGAFAEVKNTIKEQGRKIDRSQIYYAIGVGILMATQFWLGRR